MMHIFADNGFAQTVLKAGKVNYSKHKVKQS